MTIDSDPNPTQIQKFCNFFATLFCKPTKLSTKCYTFYETSHDLILDPNLIPHHDVPDSFIYSSLGTNREIIKDDWTLLVVKKRGIFHRK